MNVVRAAMELPVLSRSSFNGKNNNKYPFSCSFYKSPPDTCVHLDIVEELALNRLNLLREIDQLSLSKKSENEIFLNLTDKISSFMKGLNEHNHQNENIQNKKHENISLVDIHTQREYDNISHFLLRLAFCSNEDNRRWFITQEEKLFKYRLRQLGAENLGQFMDYYNLPYKQIDVKDIDSKELYSFISKTANHCAFKVDFLEALDLIKNRQAFLQDGFAYVNPKHLESLICLYFKNYLQKQLINILRSSILADEDNRLMPLLNHLRKAQVSKFVEYTHCSANKIPLDQIDKVSLESFPLCMLNMHENFRTNHHLKYQSRLQYGLFLKGIGLTIEESLEYWKSEFTKKIDGQKFDRMYSYNIRYIYGKEGRKKNMFPYSCMSIINSSCTPTDCSGCPYKTMDSKSLHNLLKKTKISETDRIEIVDLAPKNYQLACSKYFESIHKTVTDKKLDISVEHPNKYFDLSRTLFNEVS